MKSIFGGGAIIAAALLTGFLIFSARPLLAETITNNSQKPSKKSWVAPHPEASEVAYSESSSEDMETRSSRVLAGSEKESQSEIIPATGSVHYVATAYSLRGRTASGKFVSQGIIAADPRVLPLGSRVRLEAGAWSGEYLVADTGGAIRGRKIDIWTPSTREARRFGRRTVKLTVLSYGGKRSALKKRA